MISDKVTRFFPLIKTYIIHHPEDIEGYTNEYETLYSLTSEGKLIIVEKEGSHLFFTDYYPPHTKAVRPMTEKEMRDFNFEIQRYRCEFSYSNGRWPYDGARISDVRVYDGDYEGLYKKLLSVYEEYKIR